MTNQTDLLSKEENKTIRELFSGTIKENFLIEILHMVIKDPRYINLFLGSLNKMFSVDSMVKGKMYNYLDICKMIVMTHYKNVVRLSDSQRNELQSKTSYKNKLVNDVIEMLILKSFATPTYSNTSLEAYYPLIYFISALNNYCATKFDDSFENSKFKTNTNKNFSFKILPKLILKVRGCIALAEIRSSDDLIVIYRSFIELFMTYAALWDESEEAIETYYIFDQVTFDYNRDTPIPEEFKNMAKEYNENNYVSFINYGWIKSLSLFNEIDKSKNMFKLGTLGKILDLKYSHIASNFGTGLYNLYKSCNPQTHGTALMMNYFELELSIFQNISIMMKFICGIMKDTLTGLDFKVLDIDLVERMNYLQHESEEIFAWLYLNEENEYKTNIDFRNRAICSGKLG